MFLHNRRIPRASAAALTAAAVGMRSWSASSQKHVRLRLGLPKQLSRMTLVIFHWQSTRKEHMPRRARKKRRIPLMARARLPILVTLIHTQKTP